MAYENTAVAVERSQGEIRKLLQKYGAQRFQFSEGEGMDARQWVALEFVHAANFERPHLIRISVPLKLLDEEALKEKADRAYSKTYLQLKNELFDKESRRIWRVIYFMLKSRMESVAEEVETFEQAFLPHIVDPASGATLWMMLKGPIGDGRLAIGGKGLALPAGKGYSEAEK